MGIRFRLSGLAETYIDFIKCPNCGCTGQDDTMFSTELTKVTFEGIVAVLQCRVCSEFFVPDTQRLGVLDCNKLRLAVEKDLIKGEKFEERTIAGLRLSIEKLNAERQGRVH
jgi:hypothetical protein